MPVFKPQHTHYPADKPREAFSSKMDKRKVLESLPLNSVKDSTYSAISHFAAQRLETTRAVLKKMAGLRVLHPGKYKLKFTPLEGGAYCPDDYSILEIRDLVRAQVIKLNEGLLVLYGQKAYESIWEKVLSTGGHSLCTLPNPQYQPPRETLERIIQLKRELEGRPDLGEGAKEERQGDLDAIISNLEKTIEAQEKVLEPATGAQELNGKDLRKHQLARGKIKEIGGLLKKINGIDERKITETWEKIHALRKETESSNYGFSGKKWPIQPQEAEILAGLFSANGNDAQLEKLDKFLSGYLLEMRKNIGVERLQFSAIEQIYLIVLAIQLSIERAMRDGVEEKKINSTLISQGSLKESLHKILKLLRETDLKFDELASGKISSENRQEKFRILCELGQIRNSISYHISVVRRGVQEACLERKEMLTSVIADTLAKNLVRVSRNEGSLWRSFFDNSTKRLLESKLDSKQCKDLLEKIEEFAKHVMEKGERDAVGRKARDSQIGTLGKLKRIVAPAEKKPNHRSFKDEKQLYLDQMEKMILDELKTFSGEAAFILKSGMQLFRTHSFYKRGGFTSHCDNLDYYLTGERLTIVREGRGQKIRELIDENKKLFSVIDKYGFGAEILSHLENFAYLEANAFDTDAGASMEKLSESKSSGKTIELDYRVDIEGEEQKVSVWCNEPRFSTEFFIKAPIERYERSPFTKDYEEVILGSKKNIFEFLSSIDEGHASQQQGAYSVSRAYEILSDSYLKNRDRHAKAKPYMSDPNSKEHLASYLRKRAMNGLMYIKNGNGRQKIEVYGNAPSLLEEMPDERDFREVVVGLLGKEYENDPKKAQDELSRLEREFDWYNHQRPAYFMFHDMHSRKFEWAYYAAQKIALS